VPGHRPVAQAPREPGADLPGHVGLPALAGRQPLFDARLERAERQEPVRRLARLRHGVAERAPRIDELDRAERRTALLALIAVRARALANRTRARDEAVRQEHLRLRVVELRLRLDHEVAGDLPEELAARLV